MSSTVIKTSRHKNDYEFVSQDSHIDLAGFDAPLSKESLSSGVVKSDSSINFLSDTNKVLLSPLGSFYHFIVDHAGSSLDLYRQDSSIEFVIDTSMLEGMPGKQGNYLLESFLKLLDYYKIKYQTFSRSSFDVININNFYIKHYYHQIGDPQTALFDMYKGYLQLKDSKPTKDIYLSRSMAHSVEDLGPVNVRIDDEKAIEEYFSSLGFEIVRPEDFSSLDEQIEFLHGVRTLVSLTSSGITNSTFMQPGQTVIELVTPITIDFPDDDNAYYSKTVEELHHFYVFMSFRKKHKYIGISNEAKSAKALINNLESDELFKSFINRKKKKGIFKR